MSRKIKKAAAFVLAAGMIVSCGITDIIPGTVITVSAAENSSKTRIIASGKGDNYKWKLNNKGTLTISGEGKLPEDMFYNCPTYSKDEIKTIIIEEGITETGEQNFSNLKNLTRVELPESLEKIGSFTFYSCTNLKEINLPSHITDIGACAFNHCSSLEELKLPPDLTNIGAWAFQGCGSLKEVNIPAGIKDNIKHAFEGCYNLKKYNIDENNKFYFFDGKCMYKKEHEDDRYRTLLYEVNVGDEYTVLDGTDKIGKEAFAGHWTLKKINFSEDGVLKVIGEGAFSDCNSLEGIDLPQGLVIISDEAFKSCENLKSVKIPASVKNIGGNSDDQDHWSNAFYNCKSLKKITVDSKNEVLYVKDWILYSKSPVPSLIIVPANCQKSTLNVPDGIRNIGEAACGHNSFITEVNLPDSIETIGECAFWDDPNLQKINMSDGVQKIDDGAFCYCTSLEKIVIPDSVTYLGEDMFAHCTALKDVTLPNGIDVLNKYMFCECESLEKIKIPDSVKTIDRNCFDKCIELKKVTLPKNLENIEFEAFKNCISLKRLVFPESLVFIDSHTFFNCYNLEEVVFNSRPKAHLGAFIECDKLDDSDLNVEWIIEEVDLCG